MALTKLQKHLIVGLRIFGVENDAIVGIVSAMESEEQQCRLGMDVGTRRGYNGRNT